MDRDLFPTADLEEAGGVLRRGGVCVYPTETYFALGAAVLFPEALARVAAIKGRPTNKPLPLLAADLEQALGVLSPGFAATSAYADLQRLAEAFWPGPLSLVMPAREELSPLVKDALGRTSIRVTPHPVAAALCRRAASPLSATSANVSGRPPAARAIDLDPAVCALADAVIADPPEPAGGPASTVAVPGGGGRLTVVRPGAVTAEALIAAGFSVVCRAEVS
ncbi:MAG: L-threonylcarbamoyladenylate synthase [Desulfovibrionaceae bacterium]|nr:L-threonylcarbamoyladenylate synthase [Desulfovibrionaceae bacterium]